MHLVVSQKTLEPNVVSMCVLYELIFISWETCQQWMPHKQGILEFGQMLAKLSCLCKALTTHCFVENWAKCAFCFWK